MRKTMNNQAPNSNIVSNPVIAGPFSLDVDTRRLTKNGSTFALKRKECALLQLFMTHPGEILTRPSLMKEVWATDYAGDTRTLEVHVCWLRKHIEEDPGNPAYLQTVRGVGYCFDPERRANGRVDEPHS